MAYADVEALFIGFLVPLELANRHVTDLPADLDPVLPLIHAEAFGGNDTTPGIDVVNLDVDYYAGPDGDGNPDRAAALVGAEAVRTAVRFKLAGYRAAGATVLKATTTSRPTIRPFDESAIRRAAAVYQLTVQSHG